MEYAQKKYRLLKQNAPQSEQRSQSRTGHNQNNQKLVPRTTTADIDITIIKKPNDEYITINQSSTDTANKLQIRNPVLLKVPNKNYRRCLDMPAANHMIILNLMDPKVANHQILCWHTSLSLTVRSTKPVPISDRNYLAFIATSIWKDQRATWLEVRRCRDKNTSLYL